MNNQRPSMRNEHTDDVCRYTVQVMKQYCQRLCTASESRDSKDIMPSR